jgi:hypothetical protein
MFEKIEDEETRPIQIPMGVDLTGGADPVFRSLVYPKPENRVLHFGVSRFQRTTRAVRQATN